ncbi:hypothetical protein RRU01S_17_00080 [Agrobacterium rubi TR3 = NBRC 13261]|uniref:Uncharacterized protein n=1 Tax=Agrobacterium rubi TR3 = NBRC 13261 TaxID=1368415 RepID=A0A081CXL2_9HYPH|nr:hypothetical protein [Agrobacterium rubi]GAK71408.1 hypothetical protein RRU01S_17_00080 [Agrobacterium rubi TR3 = NBRC 13261]
MAAHFHFRSNIAVEKPICYEGRMGSKFGCLAQNIFVLQDHKRLPARFFARISGALGGRLTFA